MRNIPMLSKALLTRQTDRLIISLQADSLFASGSATLSEDARAALYAMGDNLRHVSNQLVVVGHTDPNPVQQGQYASNWELSVHRALVVADALANAGYTRDITAMGLAESQYKDVDTDLDQETRFRNARRVDVIIREIEGGKNDD